ncbi:MAG TPA: hypothetical protein VJP86_07320 [Vicinamibacterales bacterium]|jgi:hypothetical protein|nr:hypothetical protein [Vicinamibacterales bacterium]
MRTLVLSAMLALGAAGILPAADSFKLTIGNPIAVMLPAPGTSSNVVNKKFLAQFVVRGDGCTDSSVFRITGTAEGLVDGTRQSLPLAIVEVPSFPGVYGVRKTWPAQGDWIAVLTGRCRDATAAAIVPIKNDGFLREAIRFYSRAATPAEIESALKAMK